MSKDSNTVWLVVGIEPSDSWPLVEGGGKFNGVPSAWTAFWDKDRAFDKVNELNASDEHLTEWTAIPRRVQ